MDNKFRIYSKKLREKIAFEYIDEIRLNNGEITSVKVKDMVFEIDSDNRVDKYTGFNVTDANNNVVELYEMDWIHFKKSKYSPLQSGLISMDDGEWRVDGVPLKNILSKIDMDKVVILSEKPMTAVELINRLELLDLPNVRISCRLVEDSVTVLVNDEEIISLKPNAEYIYYESTINKYDSKIMSSILGEAMLYLVRFKVGK